MATIAAVLPPQEVIAKIEKFAFAFLQGLSASSQELLTLELAERRVASQSCEGEDDVFGPRTIRRHFTEGRGRSSQAFTRVWKVLQTVHKLLNERRMATQREIFYSLLPECPCLFPDQRYCNEAIQDAVALLACSRCSLGIYASSRGAIAGSLMMKEGSTGTWIDCSTQGSAGVPISGNLWLLERLNFCSKARYVIIVEKDAVFQRLAEDRLWTQLPCILVTAKGFPDLATRSQNLIMSAILHMFELLL